jgi:PAS domain S-box-containing protein
MFSRWKINSFFGLGLFLLIILQMNAFRNAAILLSFLLSLIIISTLLILCNILLTKNNILETIQQDQNQLFKSILDCMGDGVVVRDMKGKFILINPAGIKLLGNKVEQVQFYNLDGKTLLADNEHPMLKAILGHSLDNLIYLLKSPKNHWTKIVNTSVRPLLALDGQQKGGITVFRDISEAKEAQDELETFSYSVSHDLSSPLRSIMGFCQIILDNQGDSFNLLAKDALLRVIRGTEDMGKVIEGLLELSRLSRINLITTNVNLSLIIQNISIALLQLTPLRKVNFVVPKNIMVNGDAKLLMIIMNNLMNNAYKFTSQKSETIIEFGILKINNEDTYFLRDNGSGFDMRHSEKLFGAFERLHSATEFPGTGIGLATVQRAIKRHNGRIWAEARQNLGATFYFTLSLR